MKEELYMVKIKNGATFPAYKDETSVGGWTNLDTWEDFLHEIIDSIEIPSFEVLKIVPEMLDALIYYCKTELCDDCDIDQCEIKNCAAIKFKGIIERATGKSIEDLTE